IGARGTQLAGACAIMRDEQSDTAVQPAQVVVHGEVGTDEGTRYRRPLVAHRKTEPRLQPGPGERGAHVRRCRIELRELGVLGHRMPQYAAAQRSPQHQAFHHYLRVELASSGTIRMSIGNSRTPSSAALAKSSVR